MTGLKNISKAEVLTLKDEVAYQKGQDCEQDARAERRAERDCFSPSIRVRRSARTSPAGTPS